MREACHRSFCRLLRHARFDEMDEEEEMEATGRNGAAVADGGG